MQSAVLAIGLVLGFIFSLSAQAKPCYKDTPDCPFTSHTFEVAKVDSYKQNTGFFVINESSKLKLISKSNHKIEFNCLKGRSFATNRETESMLSWRISYLEGDRPHSDMGTSEYRKEGVCDEDLKRLAKEVEAGKAVTIKTGPSSFEVNIGEEKNAFGYHITVSYLKLQNDEFSPAAVKAKAPAQVNEEQAEETGHKTAE